MRSHPTLTVICLAASVIAAPFWDIPTHCVERSCNLIDRGVGARVEPVEDAYIAPPTYIK